MVFVGCFVPSQSQLLVKKRQYIFLKSSSHGSNPFRCSSKGFSSSFSVQPLPSKPYNRNPIHVTSEYGHPSKSKPEDLNQLSNLFRAFYLFSRPHTIIGTVSSGTSDFEIHFRLLFLHNGGVWSASMHPN